MKKFEDLEEEFEHLENKHRKLFDLCLETTDAKELELLMKYDDEVFSRQLEILEIMGDDDHWYHWKGSL